MLITLLGAECTGKSSLCSRLGERLGAATVPEYLREWCLTHQRTPTAAEQAGIAAEQQRRIASALSAGPGVVVADTTALMTAVYSLHYFGDTSLLPAAVAAQREATLTLLCCPDGLPWEPAGWLRDGEAARAAVHALLLEVLAQERLSYTLLRGSLQNRVATVLDLLSQGSRP